MEPFTKSLLDRAKGLVGCTVTGVDYYAGVDDELGSSLGSCPVAHWNRHGVELRTDRGVLAVISSDALTDGTYELALVDDPSIPRSLTDEGSPMALEVPWGECVGHTIAKSRIHWVDSPYVALAKRRKAFSSHHFDVDGAIPFAGPQAPLALELHCEGGGRALVVSGRWAGIDQPIVETGQGVCVLWDANTFSTLVPRIAKELKKSW
jgi:hypothetical protein